MSEINDPDNPEWTDADVARSKPASALPASVRAAFPKTRAAQTEPPAKVPISLRLSVDVIEHFKAQGPDWERRIDDTLRAVIR